MLGPRSLHWKFTLLFAQISIATNFDFLNEDSKLFYNFFEKNIIFRKS